MTFTGAEMPNRALQFSGTCSVAGSICRQWSDLSTSVEALWVLWLEGKFVLGNGDNSLAIAT